MKIGASTNAVQVVVIYLLLLLIASISSANACTLDGCDHPDCGSCGNACCSLLITIQGESTESVMNKLNSSITEGGGPDNRYIPMMTASGTMTFSDLRKYGADADFLGQALHTTMNGKYNDTVNLSLSPTTLFLDDDDEGIKGTIIAAFSISDIAGAYCDSGQNYWNILQLIQSIDWDENYDGGTTTPFLVEHVGDSCPATATPPLPPPNKKEEEDNNILVSLLQKDKKDINSVSSSEDLDSLKYIEFVKYIELRDNNVYSGATTTSSTQDMILPFASSIDASTTSSNSGGNSEIEIEIEEPNNNNNNNKTNITTKDNSSNINSNSNNNNSNL